jgi:cytidylate kinase
LSRFYDIDWENPLNYHIILNTGKWELDDVVELLIGAVTHLRVPKQY